MYDIIYTIRHKKNHWTSPRVREVWPNGSQFLTRLAQTDSDILYLTAQTYKLLRCKYNTLRKYFILLTKHHDYDRKTYQ